MNVNRAIAPTIKPIKKVELLDIDVKSLKNGIQLYHLHGGDQKIVSIQLVYPAGRWFETKSMQAFLTSAMMTEGTKNKTSQQISETVDFYGAQFSVSASYDDSTIHIVTLAKHVVPILSLLSEILIEATFPEGELQLKKTIGKQKLLVNNQKTDFVCQRKFLELVYGENHPYGYTSGEQKFDAINQSDLIAFYKSNFQAVKPIVILSGNYTNQDFEKIQSTLGDLPTGNAEQHNSFKVNTQVSSTYIPFDNANQTSIRMGRPTIKPGHEDFAKLQLTNAILGGYFGSRLMSNLREEKGLTYGVSSHLGSFSNQGYWFIGTDVGKDKRNIALTEIKKEIELLQNEKVSDDEIELVRNYLMGKKLSSVDGPFAQARLHRSLLSQQQTASDFQNRIEVLLSTTADDVREMAQKYFPLDELVEVMVG